MIKGRRFKLIEGIKDNEYLIEINKKLMLVRYTPSENDSCNDCILYRETDGVIDDNICKELFDRTEGRTIRSFESKLCSPYYTYMKLTKSRTYLSLFIMSYIRCDRKYINYIISDKFTLAINC